MLLLHTLIGKFPEFLQLISTETDPHLLQMLRCTSKAFRDGADKEQCTASAVAKYTRAVLFKEDGGFFRLCSMYGCHKIDIGPVYTGSDIDGLVCTRCMGSYSYQVLGDRINVIVTYNGRRFLGYMTGEFDSPTELDVIDLGSFLFQADGAFDLIKYNRVWISLSGDDGDSICVRVNLDAGGLIGEVFADYCFYSV